MKKIFGILGLFIAVYVATILFGENFMTAYNQENLIRRTSLYGILAVGVAFVIITGGIDLSIGSMVCLVGCGLPWLLVVHKWPVPLALLAVAGMSVGFGLVHGLLITQLKLQPFIVTLCGLLLYRGIARGMTQDQTQGFLTQFQGLRKLATGEVPVPFIPGFGIPFPFLILLIVALLAAVFLNWTIYGRYLLALGRNEEAARFSGINTNRMIIFAYVICSSLAGLGGTLFILDSGSAQPVDFGNFYELYAIAAAVLGGCSLRGGQGSILGVVIGAALMQTLYNMINLVDAIPTNIEFAVIGAVILGGVIADELVKLWVAQKRASQAAAMGKEE